jgi:hypothetical protein
LNFENAIYFVAIHAYSTRTNDLKSRKFGCQASHEPKKQNPPTAGFAFCQSWLLNANGDSLRASPG